MTRNNRSRSDRSKVAASLSNGPYRASEAFPITAGASSSAIGRKRLRQNMIFSLCCFLYSGLPLVTRYPPPRQTGKHGTFCLGILLVGGVGYSWVEVEMACFYLSFQKETKSSETRSMRSRAEVSSMNVLTMEEISK